MKKTLRQNLKGLSATSFRILRGMCKLSKNLYNRSLYEVRQYFFNNGEYLSYNKTYQRVKYNENYELLPSQVAQQTMKNVDKGFQSFFKLNEKKKEGKYDKKISPPGYLDKDSHYMIDFPNQSFQIKGDHIRIGVPKQMREEFDIEQKEIKIPFTYEEVRGKEIKRLQILPKGSNCDYFEYRLIYEEDVKKSDVDPDKFLSIDIGVDNLATCVDHTGRSFILDGRKLKSVNWWSNKKIAGLQSIKDKQGIDGSTKRLDSIYRSRRNKIHDYLNKVVHALRKYCLEHKIGTIIIGDGSGWKQEVNLGDVTNQNFVQIPFDLLKQKLKGMCEEYGINLEFQDESYTSKTSFFNDEFPERQNSYDGNRRHRGLFVTSNGQTVNADLNAALQIARKFLKGKQNANLSKLEDCVLSDVDSPRRIREPFDEVRMSASAVNPNSIEASSSIPNGI